MTTRRKLILGSGVVVISGLTAGCITPGSSPEVTIAQIITDIKNIVNVIPSIVSAVQIIDPVAIPKNSKIDLEISNIISVLKNTVPTLTVTAPITSTIPTLQQVDTYINTVFQIIGAIIPAAAIAFPPLAPYVVVYDAVVSLLPSIEAFINSNLPTSASKSVSQLPTPIKAIYSPDDARLILSKMSQ